jgi:DNA end-binding protein Ku
MHFADEVDPPDRIVPSRLPAVSSRELGMALELIESFSGRWKPAKYRDTYTAALEKVIRAKQAGKEIHRAPEPEPEEQPDLLEALRESVRQHRGGKRRKPANGKVSRKQLEAQAKKLGIDGRSTMSKDELAKAVAKAA